MYNKAETILYYDFEIKDKNTTLEIDTEDYWIPKLPGVIEENWESLNSKCLEYYRKIFLPYMLKLKKTNVK